MVWAKVEISLDKGESTGEHVILEAGKTESSFVESFWFKSCFLRTYLLFDHTKSIILPGVHSGGCQWRKNGNAVKDFLKQQVGLQ